MTTVNRYADRMQVSWSLRVRSEISLIEGNEMGLHKTNRRKRCESLPVLLLKAYARHTGMDSYKTYAEWEHKIIRAYELHSTYALNYIRIRF
jgi:hypothetical protein